MTARERLRIVTRIAAATLGSYAVTAGAAALVAVALVATAHLSRSDALIVGSMIAYLLFTFLMLWCFAERRLGRVLLILVAGALSTHGLAVLIERNLPVLAAAS